MIHFARIPAISPKIIQDKIPIAFLSVWFFVIKSTTQKRIAQDHQNDICDRDHAACLHILSALKKITHHTKDGVATSVEKDYLSQH
jgi:hypothetical protein